MDLSIVYKTIVSEEILNEAVETNGNTKLLNCLEKIILSNVDAKSVCEMHIGNTAYDNAYPEVMSLEITPNGGNKTWALEPKIIAFSQKLLELQIEFFPIYPGSYDNIEVGGICYIPNKEHNVGVCSEAILAAINYMQYGKEQLY